MSSRQIVGYPLDRFGRVLERAHQTVLDVRHAARPTERRDDHVRRLDRDRKPGWPTDVVRGRQKWNVRWTVRRGGDCASSLTARAHAPAIATEGNAPSTRSADKKATSAAARIGATCSATSA